MKKFLFKLCAFLGIVLCIYTFIICILTNFNIGNLLSLSMGAILIFIGFFWLKIKKNKLVFIFKAAVLLYLCFFAFMSVFIFINSKINETDFSEDAVIVLGCALHGTTPSPTLYRRLEKTIVYAQKNKKAVIIVSGGQGPQEDTTEAEAMFKYLSENGVDKNRIIIENKSSSTYENFKFSKPILDKIFDNSYTLCYITNDFHSYRANRLAKINGINAVSFNCKTDVFSFVPLYLRECLAVIKLWIFKQ